MSELNYLEKLLDGVEVEWIRLGNLVRIKNGKDHKSLGEGDFPVYGSGGVMRYADTYAYDKPSVLIPRKGSLGNLFFVDVPFWTVDTIFYTIIDETKIWPKYLYYFLTTVGLGNMNQAGGVPSQTQSVLNELKIPIPCPSNPEKSLAIQSEIVRILDKFTALTAELTAELTARKKQYNYYRDQLLSFEGKEVEWRALGEVLNMRAGQHISASKIMSSPNDECSYPCFGGNGVRGFVKDKSHNGEHLLIGRQGALCGNVQRMKGMFYATEHAVVVTAGNEIDVDWAFHMLSAMNLNQYASQSAQPGLAVGKIQTLKIPLPCIETQKKTAKILDKFDTLTNSITEGLPREIELRQKQYEYYRDLLFSFPKPDSVTN
ncbi:restriction endonuclease subunit S [Salmonella enterica subsp. enterica]|uniref:Restriction endonuclease subunit S n=1 Tax=Kluyvera sichuanensis TaxID=2725494 RepID=A0ABR6S1S7_9ENTR|nr:restriction endonuclease subunit S [Kluyvera sichuanensis]EBC1703328.1 restriction endonuclease subunit S [Salmonella enterica subsp. enterica]EJI7804342.1 restriction endonuclease subunit S [Salmonella enterica]EBQ0067706.1 restriction endonuclease subunit S [Salmonella enterica subsp. enterica]EBQ0100024.1 restriction endonuclease subunit S [Salmonella enterica subsp. enterica]EBQ0113875.1 restriction endonuclease subunit S [Salmonella enterica subsp. enterica]